MSELLAQLTILRCSLTAENITSLELVQMGTLIIQQLLSLPQELSFVPTNSTPPMIRSQNYVKFPHHEYATSYHCIIHQSMYGRFVLQHTLPLLIWLDSTANNGVLQYWLFQPFFKEADEILSSCRLSKG